MDRISFQCESIRHVDDAIISKRTLLSERPQHYLTCTTRIKYDDNEMGTAYFIHYCNNVTR